MKEGKDNLLNDVDASRKFLNKLKKVEKTIDKKYVLRTSNGTVIMCKNKDRIDSYKRVMNQTKVFVEK